MIIGRDAIILDVEEAKILVRGFTRLFLPNRNRSQAEIKEYAAFLNLKAAIKAVEYTCDGANHDD